eukprot:SAG11_NODE_1585_length_4639_cov_1.547357_2_plen_518_part_00
MTQKGVSQRLTSLVSLHSSWMLQGENSKIGSGDTHAHAQPDADHLRSIEELSNGSRSVVGGASNPKKSWKLHQDQALWLQCKEQKLEMKRAELAMQKDTAMQNDCTFKPRLSKLPGNLYDGENSPTSGGLVEERTQTWADRRDEKLKKSRERLNEGRTSPCSFRPQLSKGSQKMAVKGRQSILERTDKYMEEKEKKMMQARVHREKLENLTHKTASAAAQSDPFLKQYRAHRLSPAEAAAKSAQQAAAEIAALPTRSNSPRAAYEPQSRPKAKRNNSQDSADDADDFEAPDAAPVDMFSMGAEAESAQAEAGVADAADAEVAVEVAARAAAAVEAAAEAAAEAEAAEVERRLAAAEAELEAVEAVEAVKAAAVAEAEHADEQLAMEVAAAAIVTQSQPERRGRASGLARLASSKLSKLEADLATMREQLDTAPAPAPGPSPAEAPAPPTDIMAALRAEFLLPSGVPATTPSADVAPQPVPGPLVAAQPAQAVAPSVVVVTKVSAAPDPFDELEAMFG